MTTIIKPSRRGFIAGMASLLAAPAIVRASSLMPVRAIAEEFSLGGVRVKSTERFIYWGWEKGTFIALPSEIIPGSALVLCGNVFTKVGT